MVVLLGNLHRDPETGAIFLEVTAQIAAQHTVSNVAKLSFTAETWAAIDTAIKLRRKDEIKLGWWHYHPDWCRNCPPEKRRDCNGSNAFLSGQDVGLHRVCFSSAYHIAALLYATALLASLVGTCSGGARGRVVARSFNVVGGEAASMAGAVSKRGPDIEGQTANDEGDVVKSKPASEPSIDGGEHERRATTWRGNRAANNERGERACSDVGGCRCHMRARKTVS